MKSFVMSVAGAHAL